MWAIWLSSAVLFMDSVVVLMHLVLYVVGVYVVGVSVILRSSL